MLLRLLIAVICALVLSDGFAQEKNQPTVDELVAKNIEAKGGASALRELGTLRLTGKLLVQEGQIQLAFLQVKKRPDEVRTEEFLRELRQMKRGRGRKDWKARQFFGG